MPPEEPEPPEPDPPEPPEPEPVDPPEPDPPVFEPPATFVPPVQEARMIRKDSVSRQVRFQGELGCSLMLSFFLMRREAGREPRAGEGGKRDASLGNGLESVVPAGLVFLLDVHPGLTFGASLWRR